MMMNTMVCSGYTKIKQRQPVWFVEVYLNSDGGDSQQPGNHTSK